MTEESQPEELDEEWNDELTDELDDDSLDEFDDELATDEAIDAIEDTMDRLLAAASVDAVYGEPFEKDDQLIIPAAEVLAFAGMGVGAGSGPTESDETHQKDTGGGSGGGGGGRVLSRPVAVIIADANGVRVEPVVDVTKISLAALTAFGFMAGMLLRMLMPRKIK